MTWFKFSPGAWAMGKVQRVSETTQLRFIKLCNLYWMKQCNLSVEDAEIEIDKKHLTPLKEKTVVKIDGGRMRIEVLDEQFNGAKEAKEDKTTRAKAGNLKRWKPELYDRYKQGELSLDDALAIAELSRDDTTPIAQGRREEKKRQEKKRKEKNIENSLLSEIEISDVELGLVEFFKIAKSFQNLFIKNLKEKNASTTHQESANFKSYVDPIRLMIKNQEATIEELQDVWDYLDSPKGEFWKTNILSTTKLREKITTLVMSARQSRPKEKQDRL